jgi:hypothetical protein
LDKPKKQHRRDRRLALSAVMDHLDLRPVAAAVFACKASLPARQRRRCGKTPPLVGGGSPSCSVG